MREADRGGEVGAILGGNVDVLLGEGIIGAPEVEIEVGGVFTEVVVVVVVGVFGIGPPE